MTKFKVLVLCFSCTLQITLLIYSYTLSTCQNNIQKQCISPRHPTSQVCCLELCLGCYVMFHCQESILTIEQRNLLMVDLSKIVLPSLLSNIIQCSKSNLFIQDPISKTFGLDELLLEEDCLSVFKQTLMEKNNSNDDDDDLLKLVQVRQL